MSLTEIKATINYLIGKAEREQADRRNYKGLDKGYKWVLSPDILTRLEEDICGYYISLARFNPTSICGIPVEIDYRTRETIELWHKVEED